MKKLFYILLTVFALSMTTGVYAQKKGHKTSKVATTMTLESFAKKWGTHYQLMCDGQIQYGWPKQFFTDMMKVMPNHFKMTPVGTEGGIAYYAFAQVLPDNYNVNAGAIGFKGSKMHMMQVDRWTMSPEYAQQLRETLKWDFDLSKDFPTE